MTFLALFLVALYRVKTVNLTQIATAFESTAKAKSSYKRLQRFFRSFEVDYDTIARFVIQVMEIPQPWVLSVDRTTWELGNYTINILMLGVIHQGAAFPLFWTFLNKRGNSNTTERSKLLLDHLRQLPLNLDSRNAQTKRHADGGFELNRISASLTILAFMIVGIVLTARKERQLIVSRKRT